MAQVVVFRSPFGRRQGRELGYEEYIEIKGHAPDIQSGLVEIEEKMQEREDIAILLRKRKDYFIARLQDLVDKYGYFLTIYQIELDEDVYEKWD